MSKRLKKLSSLALALLLLLALLPGGAMAADVVATGTCGAEGGQPDLDPGQRGHPHHLRQRRHGGL